MKPLSGSETARRDAAAAKAQLETAGVRIVALTPEVNRGVRIVWLGAIPTARPCRLR